jgi:large-conductance mechanosensitive channel
VVGAAFTDLIKTFVSSFVTPLLAAIGSRSFTQLSFSVRGQKIAYGE